MIHPLQGRRPARAGAAVIALAVATCAGPPPDGYEVVGRAATAEMREIDFESKPPYLDNNVIVLTFDDGPDDVYTAQILNILRDKGVKATFFVNTINNTNVDEAPAAQALIKRIVSEGHELATHTVHHIDLAEQTEAKIEEEIAGVENTVKKIFGAGAPALTLLRAPFGRPYQSEAGSPSHAKVSSVVARHAVHVGWAIDSNDWMYTGDAERVFRSVTDQVKKPGEGAYGVVLMHSINPQTVGALPRIIDYLKANGFVLKLTEDVVRARFGQSSAQLLGTAGMGGGGGGGGSAGAPPGGSPGPSGGSGAAAGAGGNRSGGTSGTPDAGDPGGPGAVWGHGCSYGKGPPPARTAILALGFSLFALLRARRRQR